MKGKISKGFVGLGLFFVLALIVGGAVSYYAYQVNPTPKLGDASLEKFQSCSALTNAFSDAALKSRSNMMPMFGRGMVQTLGAPEAMDMAAGAAKGDSSAPSYSETNVQVEGVDEADIVKTDGNYIYTVTGVSSYRYGGDGNAKLVIARAYPVDDSEILSETKLGDFFPREMFIHDDYVLIFGNTMEEIPMPEPMVADTGVAEKMIAGRPYYSSQLTTVQIWDVSDRDDPEKIRSVDFEGDYLSSRKIGPDVYFMVNSYPRYPVYGIMEEGQTVEGSDMIPVYRDVKKGEDKADVEFEQECGCDDVGYFKPINPERFITIVSMSMDDPEGEINKEVVVGSGQNIYASVSNLYVAESSFPFWFAARSPTEELTEKTIIHKFSLDRGDVSYDGNMEASGHILNQFSMDEYDGHFRIATTAGRLTRLGGSTSNNIYIFDEDFEMVGSIEDIAPGESIYSARFMGEKGYLVTFKKIDPFFVIDLSDPKNPKILGKLKIPGYSDYLHPYDENHIIGIGKDTEAAEEEAGDFSWYQGVKIALFDVTDVANPKEMHKVIIGDRGTDSYALHDHKAFLFDRGKNLLVIPILLAEMSESQKGGERSSWEHGEYVFQGAYVYELTTDDGFDLRGRITHYDDDDDTFLKSGYYYFDDEHSVKRSLYIGDVLYTISGKKIKLNDLADLDEIKELVFGE